MQSTVKYRFMRTAAAVVSAALLVLSLGGCALSALSAENVMEPPQAYGDGARIQAALEDMLGPQITLRYPRSGEHRSAVVRADVDNDGQEEAIVFFRQATESSGAHMVLMDLGEDNQWVAAGEFSGAEGEIDRIVFGDINGDGALDIITGWSAYSNYGTFHVHTCRNGMLSQVTVATGEYGDSGVKALSSYAELAVGDFDGDGVDELLTVTIPGDENSGEARLLKWSSPNFPGATGIIHSVGSVPLRPGVSSYIGSTSGWFSEDCYGLAADSLRTDGSYSSEIILWDAAQGILFTPESETDLFARTLSTETTDLDGDGRLDIPGDALLPDCGSPLAKKLYLTDWYHYEDNGFVPSMSTVIRIDEGYYFILPHEWQGLFTAQPGSDTLDFYLADTETPFSHPLFSIRVFTLDEWEREVSSGRRDDTAAQHLCLCITDYYVYATQIFDFSEELHINYNTVLYNFRILA